MQGKVKHRKGETSTEQIDSYLRSLFDQVEAQELGITHVWAASGKKTKANEPFGIVDEKAIADALSKVQPKED
ncbi:MAG: hypothetical protein K6T99_12315 [Armatimonadetes bacterium]|nr:hypothetical protein [Armatimonadota bacterium]